MILSKQSVKQYFLTFFVLTYMLNSYAVASEIEVQVNDNAGMSVENAVVYLEPKDRTASFITNQASVEQKNKSFIPLVTVIQTGSSVIFPNKDSVRHHVYSFSSAKKFELKLYSGLPSNPVIFDKAGTVVLGCNIHDQMLAFIYIVDTPYFAKTEANGKVKIRDIPDGDYVLKIWHYALKNENVTMDKSITIKTSDTVKTVIDIKPSI